MTLPRSSGDIFEPADDGCETCGVPLEPEPVVSALVEGIRVAWVCPDHGVSSIVNPF